MTKIPAKFGWETLLIVLVSLAVPINYLIKDFNMVLALINLGIVAFTVIIITSVRYFISGNKLIIHSLFQKSEIDILKVRKIEKTWNLIASPAPSLTHRVEIYYGNDSVVISPKNIPDFNRRMLTINPDIEIKN